MVTRDTALSMIAEFRPDWHANHQAMTVLDQWHRGQHEKPNVPRNKDRTEAARIAARAATPWLRLVVSQVVQAMFVEGYHAEDTAANSPRPWSIWQRNAMDRRQIPVHRGMVSLGISHTSVLPGMMDDGNDLPEIRSYSARTMKAWYAAPEFDEWPMFAIHGQVMNHTDKQSRIRFTLFDETDLWIVDQPTGTDRLEYIEQRPHPAGVCPIVRYTNEIDLEGRVTGDVEPHIGLIKRIDQTVNDRLVVQRFASWVVKYIAGLDMPDYDDPDAEAKARAMKLRLEVEDILVAKDADTKFGTLTPTQLDGFIKAKESDLEDLAAVSQTDPMALSGAPENIGAEGFDVLRSSANGKVLERRTSAGESHEQMLRLGAHLMGWEEEAAAFGSAVSWRDRDNQIMSKTLDGLGKAATLLKVPVELLWEDIPGWDAAKVQRALNARGNYDPLGELEDLFTRQSQPTVAAPTP